MFTSPRERERERKSNPLVGVWVWLRDSSFFPVLLKPHARRHGNLVGAGLHTWTTEAVKLLDSFTACAASPLLLVDATLDSVIYASRHELHRTCLSAPDCEIAINGLPCWDRSCIANVSPCAAILPASFPKCFSVGESILCKQSASALFQSSLILSLRHKLDVFLEIIS